jgi:hypothetical protein
MDPDDPDLLPIACTLSPSEGRGRLAAWREILGMPDVTHERLPGRVTLSFPEVAGLGEQLTELVAAERECCAFLEWAFVLRGNRWQLEVAGTDEALDSLSLITGGA